jgi:hypothetical protein
MWSLFDAAGNPIFTSNDKERVEADLARLVGETAGKHVRLSLRSPASGYSTSALAIARDVEAVEVHHFGPRGGEVVHELLLCVVAGVDLC